MSLAIDLPKSALKAKAACLHCGTSFRPTLHCPDFCCTGCQFVHGLIAQNGDGQFYDLQDGQVPPVKSLVFQKRDYTWLEALVLEGEQTARPRLKLDLQGLSCVACAWLVERVSGRADGVLTARVDPNLGTLELQWSKGALDAPALARELQRYGYLLGPTGREERGGDRALLWRLGVCGALTMNTMLFTLPGYLGMSPDFQFATLFQQCAFALSSLSFFIGGSYFLTHAWHALRQRVLHLDLPIALGLIAAYAGSVYAYLRGLHGIVYFDFVSTFTFLMLVGRWLQQKAVEHNRHQLLGTHATPPSVRDATSGEELTPDRLTLGQEFLVAPGQTVPVQSQLQSEAATFSHEWINGESEVCSAPRGRLIAAGAVNCGQEAVTLSARQTWPESLLRKLLEIAPVSVSRNTGLERFIARYLVIVCLLALSGGLAWWFTTGDFARALQVFISVLVVSCPCASGVAVPLCSDLATARVRELGLFVRNSDLWRKLDRVRQVVFDKTGTLTLEAITLRNPEILDALSAHERSVLLSLVHESPHPVSRCLLEHLLAIGTELPAGLAPARETIGFGLSLTFAGEEWRLGRPEWAARADAQGGDCVFSRAGQVRALFHLGEEARTDAREEIAALHRRGCETTILSGDRQANVAALAQRLALPAERALGELSPHEKAAWMQAHDQHDSLYLGDGANDSLAFDAAWCTGTPAIDRGLLEQKADFYFLGRGLAGVRALLETATLRRRAVRSVIAFALAYNALAVALCLAGRMNPLLAAVLMPASSLVSLGLVLARFRCRVA